MEILVHPLLEGTKSETLQTHCNSRLTLHITEIYGKVDKARGLSDASKNSTAFDHYIYLTPLKKIILGTTISLIQTL